MYYEEILETPMIEGVFFKIKRIKPTKLFSYQTLLGQVFGEGPGKDNDAETLQKCYDFILENMLFSRDRTGQFKEVQSPGLENVNLKEVEENPVLIGTLVGLFMNSVVNPIEKK